jgi:hypothetical protein
MATDEKMPCPKCGTEHAKGNYGPRPDLRKEGKGMPHAPADVSCICGAVLRHTVPLFATGPYGWHWRIVDWTDSKPLKELVTDPPGGEG